MAEVCGAKVRGAAVGSVSLRFEPGELRAGDFVFDIGTAGATGLVLHTVYLPLSILDEPSMVSITGGTHNPFSPCFHYLQEQWLPLLSQTGLRVSLKLDRLGFYPVGGGKVRATISPAEPVGLQLLDRGKLKSFRGVSFVANLDREIAERQKRRALRTLGKREEIKAKQIQVETFKAPSPGTCIYLTAEYEGGGRACYFGLGKIGKRAEEVGEEAALPMAQFLDSDAALDQFAADQLMLPLALASEPSEFTTASATEHQRTNADIITRFVDVKIEFQEQASGASKVKIIPGTCHA
jgi:RNA 3'-terminal phosphate cyclase (ATP)